jgi:hypothetical protein
MAMHLFPATCGDGEGDGLLPCVFSQPPVGMSVKWTNTAGKVARDQFCIPPWIDYEIAPPSQLVPVKFGPRP